MTLRQKYKYGYIHKCNDFQSSCESIGAHLVKIDNSDENEMCRQMGITYSSTGKFIMTIIPVFIIILF